MAGAACAWLRDPQERETGVLHMVCVLPEHRGRGLSYPLCLAVLHRFRERAYRRVALNTHEWRLGAVKVYLRLGFQPLYRHPRHPEQWAGVLRALGWTEPVQAVEEPGAWPAARPGRQPGRQPDAALPGRLRSPALRAGWKRRSKLPVSRATAKRCLQGMLR